MYHFFRQTDVLLSAALSVTIQPSHVITDFAASAKSCIELLPLFSCAVSIIMTQIADVLRLFAQKFRYYDF